MATDPLGCHAGLDLTTGQVVNEIPGAFVTEDGVDPQLIMFPEIVGEYHVQGIGVDQGDYRISAMQGITNSVIIRALSGNTELNQIYQFTFGSPLPQESGGQVVVEAEEFTYQIGRSNRSWLTQTVLTGYNDTGYLSALPDTDQIFTTTYTTTSPELLYTLNFTTTGTYYVWLRGYAPNGAGDSIYVNLLGKEPVVTLTGFVPRQWSWANNNTLGNRVTIEVAEPGTQTLRFWQREDGLRVDRILLTTNSNYIPTGGSP